MVEAKTPIEAKSGLGTTALSVAAATILCAGAGGFFGATLLGEEATKSDPSHEDARGARGEAVETNRHAAAPSAEMNSATSPKRAVRELAPIVANLAPPERSWVRLQAAIVFDPLVLPHPEALMADLMSDSNAYLRTVSVAELEGADGLRRLQDALNARAATRAQGKLEEFVIESLVVQ